MVTWSSALQAQTCGSQPSCASLGYTLSSSANCVGTVLKCPFDTSKFYCAQKSDVSAVLMPNYGSAQALSVNTKYTVGTSPLSYNCGWASFNVVAGSGSCYIYINDKTVSKITVDVSMIIPVYQNDNFKLSSGCGQASVSFFPCR